MPDVRLEVNGREYGGWTSVQVSRGIEAIAGSFELEVSERWDGQTAPWPIRDEDACVVSVGGIPLITGYVDARTHSYDTSSHQLSVSGRDKAGALVDCSAVLTQWEFANTPVLDLCTKLGAPFGVTFSLQDGLRDPAISTKAPTTTPPRHGGAPASVGSAGKSSSLKIGSPNAKLAINPGESSFDVIDRACRMVGLLPVSDGLGGVVLTRAGGARATTALVEGQNILQATASYDGSKRYRTYIVSGQAAGSDELFGPPAAAVKGEAQDQGVTRASRVLLVRPEGAVTLAFAKQRAAWEATVRRARSVVASVTVQGWHQADGTLWPINALVTLRSPKLGIDGPQLITQTTFALSANSGTTTQLTLVDPNAFIPEPLLIDSGAGGNALGGLLG